MKTKMKTLATTIVMVALLTAVATVTRAQPNQLAVAAPNDDTCSSFGEVVRLDPAGDNNLAVRSQPFSPHSPEIDELFTGDTVCIVGKSGPWFQVQYVRDGHGHAGWAHAHYLKLRTYGSALFNRHPVHTVTFDYSRLMPPVGSLTPSTATPHYVKTIPIAPPPTICGDVDFRRLIATISTDAHIELKKAACGGSVIAYNGEIVSGDANWFATFFSNHHEKIVLVLSGPGGSLSQAITIGRMVRKFNVATMAINDCGSACALIWAAGSPRGIKDGAYVGFHAGYDSRYPGVSDGGGNAAQGAYLAELGVSVETVFALIGHSPTDFVTIPGNGEKLLAWDRWNPSIQ